jgi:hypothetical protein
MKKPPTIDDKVLATIDSEWPHRPRDLRDPRRRRVLVDVAASTRLVNAGKIE